MLKKNNFCLNLFGNCYRILIIFLLSIFSACTALQAPSKIVGQEVPYTKFLKLDGDYLLTEELRGKSVVLTFWASWCSYSRPAIARIDEYARNKLKRDDVEFLAVSIDKENDLQKLKDVISSLETSKMQYFFSGNDVYDEAYMAFDAGMLPHIFIISPEGKVILDGHSDSLIYDYFGISR